MAHHLRFTALLLASTLAACGGKSFDVNGQDPNEGGSSGEAGSGHVAGRGGSSSTAGSGHAGSKPTAGTSAGGTGQGGQGGQAPDACEAFDDDAGTFIQVDIVNETTGTIYLGGEENTCAAPELFGVKTADGQALTINAECRPSCDMARRDGPIGCPALCRAPSVIALKSGEEHATNFSGLQYAAARMPKECVTSPYGSVECVQALMLEPGAFTFWSVAGSAVECALSSTQCGECQPNGAGGCTINGAVRSGTILRATTQAVLDGSYGIYPKKAPAPGEAPADEPGGSGAIALPRIRIVFF
jgi:hypothetical protein